MVCTFRWKSTRRNQPSDLRAGAQSLLRFFLSVSNCIAVMWSNIQQHSLCKADANIGHRYHLFEKTNRHRLHAPRTCPVAQSTFRFSLGPRRVFNSWTHSPHALPQRRLGAGHSSDGRHWIEAL